MANLRVRVEIKRLTIEADIDYEGAYDDDVRAGVAALVSEIITPVVLKEQVFDGQRPDHGIM